MELTIEAKKRPEGSKPNALRRQGQVPAVLYGHSGAESVALTVNTKEAQVLLRKAAVNNTLINVNVADLPWNGKVLVREVQTHPWRGDLYHISFFSVSSHDKIEITLPLHFTGDAVGVKQGGGLLDTVITELAVQCAPDNIPEAIEVDVSKLNVGDALHVNELNLPGGITVLGDTSQVVVSVLGGAAQSGSEASEEA